MSLQFYNSKTVTTRASHRCFLCYLDIPVGRKCTYEAGKHDGEFFSRHSHDECSEAWAWINKDSDQDDDWTNDLRTMGEYYPHTTYEEHKRLIERRYGK